MTQERQLHVFCNDVIEWVVAYDREDAIKVWEETTGEKRSDYVSDNDEGMLFEPCSDDGMLRICYEDELKSDHMPADAQIEDRGDGYQHIKATMRAWADANGRGFLCTTEY